MDIPGQAGDPDAGDRVDRRDLCASWMPQCRSPELRSPRTDPRLRRPRRGGHLSGLSDSLRSRAGLPPCPPVKRAAAALSRLRGHRVLTRPAAGPLLRHDAPRSTISPPHTPHGSSRSSAAVRHFARMGHVRAQRLGAFEVERVVSEPQVGIADMTRQHRQLVLADCQGRHVRPHLLPGLVALCLPRGSGARRGCWVTRKKIWPRIRLTSGPWPSGVVGRALAEAPIHGRVSRRRATRQRGRPPPWRRRASGCAIGRSPARYAVTP